MKRKKPKAHFLDGKTLLVTGGTGSFGKMFTRIVLKEARPKRFIIFSRDELKQHEMRAHFGEEEFPNIRYFIGDVRDRERLYRAMDTVDVVIHAAALKQVPAAEYNPMEAIKTNILGAANIVDATIDRGVSKVIALSTDKASAPVNLYGATKLCSDKLLVGANNYAGARGTRFSVVRYGNVVGSRGSVIPLFLSKRRTGVLPITDPRMTRFWITLEQGARFVLSSLESMTGGETFVPKIPSMNIMDVAKAVAPDCRTEIIGIRPGEKLHEVLVPPDDAHHTYEYSDRFVIKPEFHQWNAERDIRRNGGNPCPDGFCYRSDKNERWLDPQELRTIIDKDR